MALAQRSGDTTPSVADRLSWAVVAATTVLLPLAMSPTGKDAFRLPKQILFETSALLLIAIAACAVVLRARLTMLLWPRTVTWIVAAVLTWTVVTTLLSTNRLLSAFSALTVVAAIALFAATLNGLASDRPLLVIYLLLVPAVINAMVAILQRTQIWSPFVTNVDYSARLRTTAFLGNPNDIGWAMVAPLLVAATLASVSRTHRWLALTVVVLLGAAIVASETVGAVAGAAAGLFTLLVVTRRWWIVAALVVLIALSPLAVLVSPERKSLARDKLQLAAAGDLDAILSGRMPPFVTAWRIFSEHPVTGTGPGTFKIHYFDQKLALTERYAFMARHPENWGEVHNEHLQFLAEGGLPAYALFIVVLWAMATVAKRRRALDGDPRRALAQTLALPFAIALAVLTLTAFPFHLAVTLQQTLFVAAIIIGWGLPR